MKYRNKLLLISTLLILLIMGIPLLIFQVNNQQETRSRASASTTLYFVPGTTAANPLQKTVDQTASFDIMIDPGNNLPSVVKLDLQYDSSKFQPVTPAAFAANSAAFPQKLEGPVNNSGNYLISLSVGSDPTKAIQSVTKVGTFTLTTKTPTNEPTIISLGNKSQVLSVGAGDHAVENVLSATIPAFVLINQTQTTPSPTPTSNPTTLPTIVPTVVPSATPTDPTPTPTRVPSPTQSPTSPLTTRLSLSVFLHGIGGSGDNANPTDSSLSNKTPNHPTRSVNIEVYNSLNQLAASNSGSVTYASSSGSFVGTINLSNPLSSGIYTIKVKEPTHLRKLVAGIQTLVPNQLNILPPVTLVAGDVNGDNSINILDYNLILGCYSDLAPAVSCTPENKLLTDLNDNGEVNQFDYNLLLREITVQSGQ